jgi:hypothetical protein
MWEAVRSYAADWLRIFRTKVYMKKRAKYSAACGRAWISGPE